MTYNEEKIVHLQELIREKNLPNEDKSAGFKNNALKKLEKYISAVREDNTKKQIDVLCDMVIFCINTYNVDFQCCEDIPPYTDFELDNSSDFVEVLKTFSEMEELKNTETNSLDDSIVWRCLSAIYSLGYDPYIAIEETIKKIQAE